MAISMENKFYKYHKPGNIMSPKNARVQTHNETPVPFHFPGECRCFHAKDSTWGHGRHGYCVTRGADSGQCTVASCDRLHLQDKGHIKPQPSKMPWP